MTPEAAQYLDKARRCLADARVIAANPIPHIAAREAHLAAYHAAEAYLQARTGKSAKTHAGLRSEFARLAREEPRIERGFVTFLARAYELKSIADYSVGQAAEIGIDDVRAAIDTAGRFAEGIDAVLRTAG